VIDWLVDRLIATIKTRQGKLHSVLRVAAAAVV
jgi:hypothetical protein